VAVASLTAAAWSLVPGGQFQADDFRTIVRDPSTVDAAALLQRLGSGLRPLLRLSYFADGALFGLDPHAFLRTNLWLHVLTAVAIYALARSRFRDPWAAALAALFFALQPAAGETVAYVTGRSTGLSTLLLLLGLLVHERARRCDAALARRWREAAALTLFVAAALVKEVALVFPLLVILWDATVPRDPTAGTSTRHGLGPYALALAAALGLALAVTPRYHFLLSYSLALRGPLDNLAAALAALPIELSLLLCPWALRFRHLAPPPTPGSVALGLVVVAALLAAGALALRRGHPLAALALLWPLVALAPTHSLIAKVELVTEKPLYLAWVGPALALGVVARRLAASRPAALRVVAIALVALTLGSGVVYLRRRALLWSDARLLWADAIAGVPTDAGAWNNLGFAHLQAGDDHEAERAFCRALELDPGSVLTRENLSLLRVLGEAREGCP
jgi:tetratricopeptide (TPR) repeat protein